MNDSATAVRVYDCAGSYCTVPDLDQTPSPGSRLLPTCVVVTGDANLTDLHRGDAPALLAWAQHDRIAPADTCAARFREEIPNAEYRLLPGVGHIPTWDDP